MSLHACRSYLKVSFVNKRELHFPVGLSQHVACCSLALKVCAGKGFDHCHARITVRAQVQIRAAQVGDIVATCAVVS